VVRSDLQAYFDQRYFLYQRDVKLVDLFRVLMKNAELMNLFKTKIFTEALCNSCQTVLPQKRNYWVSIAWRARWRDWC
jgi:hypothetical protein